MGLRVKEAMNGLGRMSPLSVSVHDFMGLRVKFAAGGSAFALAALLTLATACPALAQSTRIYNGESSARITGPDGSYRGELSAAPDGGANLYDRDGNLVEHIDPPEGRQGSRPDAWPNYRGDRPNPDPAQE